MKKNFAKVLIISLLSFSASVLLPPGTQAQEPIDSLILALSNSTDEIKEEIIFELAMIHVKLSSDTNLFRPVTSVPLKINDDIHLALFYEQLIEIYMEKKNLDEAYIWLQKAILIYQEVGDELGLARVKKLQGLLYIEFSDFDEALSSFMDALEIATENEEEEMEAEIMIDLGLVFMALEQFQDTKDLFVQAINIWEELEDTLQLSEAYFNMAELYKQQGKMDESLQALKNSISLAESISYEKGLANSFFQTGQIYELMGEFIMAGSYYQKSLSLYKPISDRYGMAKALNQLGRYSLSGDELDKAREYLNEALIVADYINSGELLTEIYKNLSMFYEKEKLYEDAIKYFKLHTTMKDSLFSEKRFHKITELKLKLENAEKSETIEELKNISYYQREAIENQRYMLIVSAVAVLLVVVIIVIVFKQSRRRKKSNHELKIQKEKAEEADHLKSSFLANMSHEIRSPMNAIIGFSNIITDSFVLNAEVVQYMGYIKQSGANLIQLVDDIIDIAKIEAGQLKIRKESFDLTKMLEKLHISVQAGYDKVKSAKVSIHLNIPDGEQTVQIISDELRIKQVLTNFISNAVKFTEKGFIEFGYEKLPDNQLLFYTKDSGIGISEKDKELVFKRFGQVEDTYTRNTSGTGLGLAISKSIIDLLDGEIWFESMEEKGATFFFKIPVKYDTASLIKSDVSKSIAIDYDWSDKVILIVEDDDMNYRVVKTLLSKTGVQLIRAESGIEAVQIAVTNEHISLILMDIQLPKMNGYEASRKIKAEKNIPIIAVTAYAMPGEQHKSFEAGCNDFINKPYNMSELMAKIASLII
jgi:signal transduction histidine kinase